MTVYSEQGQENELVKGGKSVKSGDVGVAGCSPDPE